ncbi:MAG TPA: NAD(P)-dependent oxidoreductase [Paludibacteraceae bacterium]|nr:NAD(P)-dependent oxidoreductase [Paludibacteraceae bacterium]
MKILVTGYSGFIGSYLIRRLQDLQVELILCDLQNGINICNWNEVKDLKGFDIIIHLANLSFVPASFRDPKKFYEVNYLGTLNMLELCRLNKARMIYFSSYMYGNPQYQPIDEQHRIEAYNPYAQTKVICESLCEGYNRDFQVPVTVFRPFNIYGKGQNPDFLIPTIINQAKTGKIVIKDDRPKRDYIHVTDIVEAVILALQTPNLQPTLQTYNLGTGESHSVKEIIEIVRTLSEHEVDYECTREIRPNEVLDTVADITKIKKELHWTPKISLIEGIKSMMD